MASGAASLASLGFKVLDLGFRVHGVLAKGPI